MIIIILNSSPPPWIVFCITSIFSCVVISVLFCTVKGGFTFFGNKFDFSYYSYNKIYNYSSLSLLQLSFNARGDLWHNISQFKYGTLGKFISA